MYGQKVCMLKLSGGVTAKLSSWYKTGISAEKLKPLHAEEGSVKIQDLLLSDGSSGA